MGDCQYAIDVDMPGHHCRPVCKYEEYDAALIRELEKRCADWAVSFAHKCETIAARDAEIERLRAALLTVTGLLQIACEDEKDGVGDDGVTDALAAAYAALATRAEQKE